MIRATAACRLRSPGLEHLLHEFRHLRELHVFLTEISESLVMTIDWNPSAAKAAGPRADRKSQLVPVEIASDRVKRTKVIVRNMSPFGLGVRGEIELLACERLVIYLPDGREVGATVRWARKNTFGLALDEAINPAALQPKVADRPTELTTRDDLAGFIPVQVQASTQRPGFVRSPRDQIFDGASHWTRD